MFLIDDNYTESLLEDTVFRKRIVFIVTYRKSNSGMYRKSNSGEVRGVPWMIGRKDIAVGVNLLYLYTIHHAIR